MCSKQEVDYLIMHLLQLIADASPQSVLKATCACTD
jgi:hypothetical protein